MSFVDYTTDFQNFQSPEFGGKVSEGSTLIFGELPEFPYNTV